MEAVEINGLLFRRMTRVSPDGVSVEYEHREGPMEVTLRIKAPGGSDNPTLATLIAYGETIQRAPK